MNAPLATTPAVDLLAEAIELTREYLDREKQITKRVQLFWAAVAAGRYLGAADVVYNEFFHLAAETGLITELEEWGKARRLVHHGSRTIEHLIRWGMLRRNPFARSR
jgi:hypothetical protein